MFIVFTLYTQVDAWYFNIKKVGEIQNDESGGIYPIQCLKLDR